MASSCVNSPSLSTPIFKKLVLKIKTEMKVISFTDSIMRDCVEAGKNFSLETVMLDFVNKMPTCMSLLFQLIRNSSNRKPHMCHLAYSF